jgi:hypothetical protein
MAKATTKLSAQDRVILFCAATGIDHAAVGTLAHAMQSQTECVGRLSLGVRVPRKVPKKRLLLRQGRLSMRGSRHKIDRSRVRPVDMPTR